MEKGGIRAVIITLVVFLYFMSNKPDPCLAYDDSSVPAQTYKSNIIMKKGLKKLVIEITIDLEDDKESMARVGKLLKKEINPLEIKVDIPEGNVDIPEGNMVTKSTGRILGGGANGNKRYEELEQDFYDKQKRIFGVRLKDSKKYSPTTEDIREIRAYNINLAAKNRKEEEKEKEEKREQTKEKLKMNGPRQRIPIITDIEK